ncbi:hypothetical protein CDAR_571551 [Caerostris darwini]|uniref:Uncharacterized protein n=1 Tax=Caerostris darwini TaxID=1538125 RepID=A0AAV4WE70_9ARAC|nr:hypothetical protein CDAR_571551 [Caerostris darwini]
MRRWKKPQKDGGPLVHGCCGYRHGWRVSPDNYNATVGQLKRVRTTPGFRHEPDTSPAGTNGKKCHPKVCLTDGKFPLFLETLLIFLTDSSLKLGNLFFLPSTLGKALSGLVFQRKASKPRRELFN